MIAPVFISYRRDDGGSEAIALRDALRREFGEESVFMDTSSLQAGVVWADELQAGIEAAETVLAVVGPDWLRAGSNEWGQRRIDQEQDWVRRELGLALTRSKRVIPVLVRGARLPPADVLPEGLKHLAGRQAIELRRDYWDHDIKLLLAQIVPEASRGGVHRSDLGPYPLGFPEGPDPIAEDKLQRILNNELQGWKRLVSPLPEKADDVRIELFRAFEFKSFRQAIQFMGQVAPGCDIAMHHPRWENIWKTIRIYLTTWDIGHRVSDRDVQLARYFDQAYSEFYGSAKAGKQAGEKLAHKGATPNTPTPEPDG